MGEFSDAERASGLAEVTTDIREMRDIRNRIGTWLEERLAAENMPELVFTKRELRTDWVKHKPEINPDEELTIKPVKPVKDDKNWWVRLNWEIGKVNGEATKTPYVEAEEIDGEKMEKYRGILPREYRGKGKNEKVWIFRNDLGKIVGRVNVTESYDHSGCSLGYIETAISQEHQGFGSAMLKWLKNKYEDIGLTPLAYSQTSHPDPQGRLEGFYAKNGFRYADSGMCWSKEDVNYEDMGKGEKNVFNDEVIIGGDNVAVSWVMLKYLEKLDKTGLLEKTLGQENVEAARTWMKLSAEENRLMEKQKEMWRYQN